ncbi:hypothetical protein, partial [Bacillus mycoides]|uniref:hypothetical protein n=1 Tax=Bacillus mycoides TaxID=1405 RepID=UPI003A80B540
TIHEKLGVYTVHSLLADCVCGFDDELGITKEGLTVILNSTREAFDSMLKDSKLESGWEWKRSELFGSLDASDVDKVKHYIKHGNFPIE